MSGVYRESAFVTRVPLEEIAWRRRVGKGAAWLVAYLLLGFLVMLVLHLLSVPRLGIAMALLAVGAIGVAATWMLTAAKPGQRVDWLAWILRATIVTSTLLIPLTWMRALPLPVDLAVALVIDAAGLAYVARLFNAAGDPRHAWQARALIAPLLLSRALVDVWDGLPVAISLPVELVGIVSLVWTFALLWRLRRLTLVIEHQWFLDTAAASPDEWVSLLLHRDGHAAVVSVEGEVARFESKGEALAWLTCKAFVPGARAVGERLVAKEPPSLLPANV